MFGIGAPELVLILILALIIFGPGRLPQIGASLGRGIRDFKAAVREVEEMPAAPTTTPEPAPAKDAQPQG